MEAHCSETYQYIQHQGEIIPLTKGCRLHRFMLEKKGQKGPQHHTTEGI